MWWNELWMGYPIGAHYKEQSNVTNAHKLTGKLLLVVGEMDGNVDPVSTMQLVDALVKASVAAGRLRATLSAAEAMRFADVALLCVGTPSARD